MSRVAVVGGGVSGLAAARRLAESGHEVVVLEQADRIGGKLAGVEVGGTVVDVGAESLLNQRPEAVDLVRAAGLGDDVVHPATISSRLWNRGRLVPMPRTMMGVPGSARSVADVLSQKGVARAALESHQSAPVLQPGDDVSVGAFLDDRYGREVTDRLVEPLLGGVYAGHARELSLRATMPKLVAALDGERTLTRIASDATDRPPPETPVFAGVRGGVHRLPRALARTPGVSVETSAAVRVLERTADGWRLEVGSAREPRHLDVEAVVLATPGRPTARLLAEHAPRAAHELDRIEYASMAVLTFAFAARDLPEVEGSGFLTPPVDGRRVKAATWSFNKWDWVRAAGEEQGVRLLRCSIGRHRQEEELQRTDEELAELALADLADAVGLSVRPVDQHVQRWGGGLPQYAVGHLERVAAVRRELSEVPGLEVCGAAYDGVGVAACVASGERAADAVIATLVAEHDDA